MSRLGGIRRCSASHVTRVLERLCQAVSYSGFLSDASCRIWPLAGTVKLTREDEAGTETAIKQSQLAHERCPCRVTPGRKCVFARSPILTGRESMTAELKEVVDRGVSGEKLLGMPG